MGEHVGRISAVWRFPVKSMQGESLPEAMLTAQGIAGDRAYALIDEETGKVVSAKSAKRFPEMFGCRARFVAPPVPGVEHPPVVITLPDGTAVGSDDADCDQALSRFFGRKVRLSASAPEDFTIDQYHPDIADADPGGHRDTVVEAKLGAAFFAEIGAPSPVPAGAFFDLFPVSLLTSSSLRTLSRLAPDSRFDERRFRMNLIVDADEEGFAENEWVGRALAIGDAARLRVALPDPRCVMPTLAQDELPEDADVLRTLVRHNRLQIGEAGRFPCAGVYAVVEAPGTLRTGDRVALA